MYNFIAAPWKCSSPSKDGITNCDNSKISKNSAKVFKETFPKLSPALTPNIINYLLIQLWSADIISKVLCDDLLNSAEDHTLKRGKLLTKIHNTLELFPEKFDKLVDIFGSMDDPVLEKLSLQYRTQ